MHCDAISIHETVHHDVSLYAFKHESPDKRFIGICGYLSACVEPRPCDSPCVASERGSRAHNPSLSSTGKLVLLVGATST
jgi:hypothetical protein